ncbi:copper chaperone PCu(A)C [Rothia nasisuis]|uniref:copper chaperone PCu(A)C n=1 Tax=Rothia nasisuis TaxID=2109647 RepID=UPI001F4310BB|nr:copper chaperone PCu(A)C [Rothia nasisuis]
MSLAQSPLRLTTLAAVTLLAMSACGATSSDTSADSSSGAGASASASSSSSTGLTVAEAWVKANSSDMTGAFATLTNTTDAPITVNGASAAHAGTVELHTTEIDPGTGTSTMKKVEGGFTLEPGASLDLAPGGDHIMLMGMTCSLAAGTTETITLTTSAGDFSFEAEVRDYAGAQEEYAPSEASSPASESADMADHSMHMGHSGDASSAATLPQCSSTR